MSQRSDNSSSQLLRYLAVGGFNTVFGYGLFAACNWAFTGLGSYSYMYAAVVSNVVAITVAFLGYKWLVFRTSGNYLSEWIRCLGVYGSSMLIGLAGLAVLVPVLRRNLHHPEQAPYVAGAVIMIITVTFSFFGHKTISFRQKQDER